MGTLLDIGKWLLDNAGVVTSAVVGVLAHFGLKRNKKWTVVDSYVDQWWFLLEAAGGPGNQKWTTLLKGMWEDFVTEFGRQPKPLEIEYIRDRVRRLSESHKRVQNGAVKIPWQIPTWAKKQ